MFVAAYDVVAAAAAEDDGAAAGETPPTDSAFSVQQALANFQRIFYADFHPTFVAVNNGNVG